ncbi:UNVERIFIED_CONTAM: cytochrome [Sesamum radiatum]|uniref:Cytochrome n=1 Tax=Sesamum radiatum TaxID=300843 RepID=A0AAW2M2Y8_SESRA
MEIFIILCWPVLILLIFLILKHFNARKRRNLPPSPPSLPILGHLHLIKAAPHRALQALSKKYGPILYLRFGSLPILLVSSPSAAEDCFSKNDIIFANRPESIANRILGTIAPPLDSLLMETIGGTSGV